MRILIVDDNAARYRVLRRTLSEAGLVDRVTIDIVSCTNDARDRLERTQYDLMVLDILIPLRNAEEPNERAAIDLLTEVVVSEGFYKPGHIVGLTSDASTADRVNPNFSEYLWTIVRYSPTNDSWAGQITACVEYLAKKAAAPASQSFGRDVAILCALRHPELAAVLELNWKWSSPRPIDDVTFVHEGSLTSDGKVLLHSAPRG
jgi:CheY-like chemotaxis protein